jgi:hypothetical protein
LRIERGDDLEAFLGKPLVVAEQSRAEIAGSGQDDGLQASGAQNFVELLVQRGDIVTEPARAELPEVSQILAQLGGLDPRRLRERRRGDGGDLVMFEALEASLIKGEPVDRLTGNIDFRHHHVKINVDQALFNFS